MTSHYKDLQESYAKRMEHHGIGMGLFIPVSSKDLYPPCCGFFDRNGDWNLITMISNERSVMAKGFEPLQDELAELTTISIKWQPKTSLGVEEHAIDTSANTPYGLVLLF
jgi:hypothetical protein